MVDKAVQDRDPNTSQFTPKPGNPLEVLLVCLKLGLTSFGGPIAHLGYFHREYVKRRQWLSEADYADIVALCQFLPGPASSQVGISIGMLRAGMLGGIAAWVGFTLPSAIALTVFGLITKGTPISNASWMHGLMVAAVAIVSQAVWGMARTLSAGRTRGTITVAAATLLIVWQSAISQILVICLGGLVGWVIFRNAEQVRSTTDNFRIVSRPTAIGAWCLLVALLLGLPLAASAVGSHALVLFARFFRVGCLVFGGGHVVLPLLQNVVVPSGWLTSDQFLAGYGAAQAVPGPLFTFAAYLGAVMHPQPNGLLGAVVALIAIFLPSFLLVVGALPLWSVIRGSGALQRALSGVNAAVVGVLIAALYNPVWTSAIRTPLDFTVALAAFTLLTLWKLPPWIVVLFTVVAGQTLPS